VRSGPGKTAKNKKKKGKKKYSGQQQKEIDCDEPHPAPNEKTQPIQWRERPIGALVAVNSLWPKNLTLNPQFLPFKPDTLPTLVRTTVKKICNPALVTLRSMRFKASEPSKSLASFCEFFQNFQKTKKPL
jgi:hypothetical protein